MQDVLLSEACTLSMQRIVMIDIAALPGQRCTDSLDRALRAGVYRGVRFSRRCWGIAKARGASRSPNKRIRRTVGATASFLMRHRAAADSQS